MRRRLLIGLIAMACFASGSAVVSSQPSSATAIERAVPGGERPRAVYTPGTEAELAERVERSPYKEIFLEANALHEARRRNRVPGDPGRDAQKDMARAARWFAFSYAIDRTVVGGEVVPFPDEAARQATGEIVEELLLGLYERSRFAVAPPLGGWDRDIDTAGEILQWAGAFDTLLGAGFDFAGNDEVIADRLIELTSELYRNYTRPETANGYADIHQNNHRSKSGAAIATAAVVLAEYAPDPADDPDGSRDPLAWWDYGTTLVDEALRYILVTGDGAYSEGTHYERFTTETMAPFFGMWERVLGADGWTTASGRVIPAIHRTAQFGFTQDWMLALTLPDGTLAPIDDANTHEAHYFGALPSLPNQAAYAWRWANAEPPFVQEGSVDLAVDSIVAYDDSVVAAPPSGSPTSFWYEGGNAVFRSDWSTDATMVIAQGEGMTASLFGRDSTGIGRAPQSHEHMEPGSYLLYAEGSTLVLDPGYFTFPTRGLVSEPQDHNMVLVNGAGPEGIIANSVAWRNDPFGPPPQDGFASIHSTLDTDRLDSAVVTTRYGAEAGGTDIELHRRFLFVDNRYLVIADEVLPQGNDPVDLDWLVHGNGGGTSGGTYAPLPNGGTWTHDDARLTTAIATSVGAPVISSQIEDHEAPDDRRVELTHEAQYASVRASGPVRAVQVLVPSALVGPAPTVTTQTNPDGSISLAIDDPAAGRSATVSWVDDDLQLVDAEVGGEDAIAFVTDDEVVSGGVSLSAPGASAVGLAGARDDALELIAVDPVHDLYLSGAQVGHLDGGCSATTVGDRVRIEPGDAASVSWSPDPLDARPAGVIASTPARASLDTEVVLDGRRSCDAAGDALTPRWELVSAPRGSSWQLSGVDTWTPRLEVDATGTFRVRLVVTDPAGNESVPVDVEIAGGDRCADERDDDRDGLFDAADPDCDGAEPAAPVDQIGFLTKRGYLGAISSSPDAATVRRTVDGAVASIAMIGSDEGRFMSVFVHVDAETGRGAGVVALLDPARGELSFRLWQGTVIEPRPGYIGGIDNDSIVWVVIDVPD